MSNDTKNFGFKHKAGVLMPISSLPSKYGIGSFGKAALEFIDFLDATGQTCWQVLPLKQMMCLKMRNQNLSAKIWILSSPMMSAVLQRADLLPTSIQ